MFISLPVNDNRDNRFKMEWLDYSEEEKIAILEDYPYQDRNTQSPDVMEIASKYLGDAATVCDRIRNTDSTSSTDTTDTTKSASNHEISQVSRCQVQPMNPECLARGQYCQYCNEHYNRLINKGVILVSFLCLLSSLRM